MNKLVVTGLAVGMFLSSASGVLAVGPNTNGNSRVPTPTRERLEQLQQNRVNNWRALADSASERMCKIKANSIEQQERAVVRLREILAKVEEKGGSEVADEVVAAKTAINTAEQAVAAYKAENCGFEVPDSADDVAQIRTMAQQQVRVMEGKLKELHTKMKAARLAVVEAIKVMSAVREEAR